MDSHSCSAYSCGEKIPKTVVFCRKHHARLPNFMKVRLRTAFRRKKVADIKGEIKAACDWLMNSMTHKQKPR